MYGYRRLLISGIIGTLIGLKGAIGHVAEPSALGGAYLPVGGDPQQ